jgi:hypothetical protein
MPNIGRGKARGAHHAKDHGLGGWPIDECLGCQTLSCQLAGCYALDYRGLGDDLGR